MHSHLCFETEEIWDKGFDSGEDLFLQTACYSRLPQMLKMLFFIWKLFTKEILLQLMNMNKIFFCFLNDVSESFVELLDHIKMNVTLYKAW